MKVIVLLPVGYCANVEWSYTRRDRHRQMDRRNALRLIVALVST